MSEFSCLQGNEGYEPCDDAVPPRAPKRNGIRTDAVFLFACSGFRRTRFRYRPSLQKALHICNTVAVFVSLC